MRILASATQDLKIFPLMLRSFKPPEHRKVKKKREDRPKTLQHNPESSKAELISFLLSISLCRLALAAAMSMDKRCSNIPISTEPSTPAAPHRSHPSAASRHPTTSFPIMFKYSYKFAASNKSKKKKRFLGVMLTHLGWPKLPASDRSSGPPIENCG
jgi:hypothetical protein